VDSDNTTSEVETAYVDSRKSRWLDGVGVGGTVLITLVATLWALANFWTMGWSWSGVLGVALVTLLLSAMGYQRHASWHARRFDRRSQSSSPGDEIGRG
jgi:hypothetical protein